MAAVRAAGGRAVLATGRWESTRPATKRLLERLGIGRVRDEDLKLNPSTKMRAAEHKQLLAATLGTEGKGVAFFENEPRSARSYAKVLKGAHGYRLRTFSFDPDRGAVPKGVNVIRDFAH